MQGSRDSLQYDKPTYTDIERAKKSCDYSKLLPWFNNALKTDDADTCRTYIDLNIIPIHFITQKKHSLLHETTEFNAWRIAHLLIEKGLSPDTRDDQGRTALHKACQKSLLHIALILVLCGASYDVQDIHGCTPLHYAILSKNEYLVSLLLYKKDIVDISSHDALTPLHCACMSGHKGIIKDLLVHNASVNARNMYEQTPLHDAAYQGQSDVIYMLGEYGADVTLKNAHNLTPLHSACLGESCDVVKALLILRAPVNSEDNQGQTPLFYCIASDMSSCMFSVLIDHGARIHHKDKEGKTVLHIMSMYNTVALAQQFFNHIKLYINTPDIYQETPLFCAVKSGSYAMVDFLIQHGASLLMRDIRGKTVLYYALESADDKMIRTLIEYGCSVHEKGLHTHKIIHHALHFMAFYMRQGSYGDVYKIYTCLKDLLSYGADIDIDNKFYQDLTDLCKDDEYYEDIYLFLKNISRMKNAWAHNNHKLIPYDASLLVHYIHRYVTQHKLHRARMLYRLFPHHSVDKRINHSTYLVIQSKMFQEPSTCDHTSLCTRQGRRDVYFQYLTRYLKPALKKHVARSRFSDVTCVCNS
jgi:ankyrin repeat protein